MNKEELKKESEECMHNALYWLKLPISKENVEQGGSYILKLLEPREKRIEELEKENAELKEQISNVRECFISASSGDDFEMAESAREVMEVLDIPCYRHKDKREKSKLSKAKELLAKWVELFKPKGGNIPPTPIQVDTEQFLSEVEK